MIYLGESRSRNSCCRRCWRFVFSLQAAINARRSHPSCPTRQECQIRCQNWRSLQRYDPSEDLEITRRLITCCLSVLVDEYTVRVTNLPEEATEDDLMQLFKPFGKVNRVFLAKDKTTQASRGFAFVNFQNKDDAQRAIWGVNDYGYNHLILKVEWAK